MCFHANTDWYYVLKHLPKEYVFKLKRLRVYGNDNKRITIYKHGVDKKKNSCDSMNWELKFDFFRKCCAKRREQCLNNGNCYFCSEHFFHVDPMTPNNEKIIFLFALFSFGKCIWISIETEVKYASTHSIQIWINETLNEQWTKISFVYDPIGPMDYHGMVVVSNMKIAYAQTK